MSVNQGVDARGRSGVTVSGCPVEGAARSMSTETRLARLACCTLRTSPKNCNAASDRCSSKLRRNWHDSVKALPSRQPRKQKPACGHPEALRIHEECSYPGETWDSKVVERCAKRHRRSSSPMPSAGTNCPSHDTRGQYGSRPLFLAADQLPRASRHPAPCIKCFTGKVLVVLATAHPSLASEVGSVERRARTLVHQQKEATMQVHLKFESYIAAPYWPEVSKLMALIIISATCGWPQAA
jgi:hypothetical protein